MKNGFFPIACATPPLRVADCTYNAEQIISLTREAAKNGSKLVVFPELCITGYTCGDLFLQQILLDGALQAPFLYLCSRSAHPARRSTL